MSLYVLDTEGSLRCECNESIVAAVVAALQPGSEVWLENEVLLYTQPEELVHPKEVAQLIDKAVEEYHAGFKAEKKAAYDKMIEDRAARRRQLGYDD
jgi:hypothetical protein